MEDDGPKTLDVPTAGKLYFGLSKNASYIAARRGDLPVIKIGGKSRVSVVALERMLEEAHPVERPIQHRPIEGGGSSFRQERQCEYCGGSFTVGGKGGRRLVAKFCSDEHRIIFNSLRRTPREDAQI